MKNKTLLQILIILVFISCKNDDSDLIVNNKLAPKKISTIQHFNEKNFLMEEIKFIYDDKLLIKTEYTSYIGVFKPLVNNTPIKIVQNYNYLNGKFHSITLDENLSNDKIDSREMIYEKGLLSEIKFDAKSIKLERNNKNKIIGYSSFPEAKIVIDEKNNFVDIFDKSTGVRDIKVFGVRGKSIYDSMKSPFSSIPIEIRTYWTLGNPTYYVGEMNYSLGNNNRISSNKNNIEKCCASLDLKHEFNESGYPVKTVATFNPFTRKEYFIYTYE